MHVNSASNLSPSTIFNFPDSNTYFFKLSRSVKIYVGCAIFPSIPNFNYWYLHNKYCTTCAPHIWVKSKWVPPIWVVKHKLYTTHFSFINQPPNPSLFARLSFFFFFFLMNAMIFFFFCHHLIIISYFWIEFSIIIKSVTTLRPTNKSVIWLN